MALLQPARHDRSRPMEQVVRASLPFLLAALMVAVPAAASRAAVVEAPAVALRQPAAPASSVAFAAGSLIIPMDSTYQNYGMFKAYGLVFKLLNRGIPVSWAIGAPKTPNSFGGIDFTATAVDQRSAAAIGSYGYSGGPFIIDSANAAAAMPIITAWWAANSNQPNVHRATAGFNANIDITLRSAPRIAVESINSSIAFAYFNAAGIADSNGNVWSTASPGVLNVGQIACSNSSATTCPATVGDGAFFVDSCQRRYDVFVTSHNGGYSYSLTDGTNVGTQAYAELDRFAYLGGGWIALCHSILSNENNISNLYNNATGSARALFPATDLGGFLTKDGFPSISNGGGTWTVGLPDLPLTQAVPTASGVVQALPGGSVQTWHTPDGTATYAQYWPATERAAWFRSSTGVDSDWALNGPVHGGAGGGKITFLGGHSFSTSLPYSSNYEAPYLRMFLNALLFNGGAAPRVNLEASVASFSEQKTTSFQISFRNVGATIAKGVGSAQPVTVTLAPNVTYVGMAAGPAPTVSSSGGSTVLTWSTAIGDVQPQAAAFVINATAQYSATGSQPLASVQTSYSDPFSEPFSTSGCLRAQVNPAPAALITKTPAAQGPLPVGSVVTWTLTYSNPGSVALQSPYVEDLLPASLTYYSATPAPTYVARLSGGTTRIRWTLASPLAAGGGGTIALKATLQTYTGQPFTNSVTFAGKDTAGVVFTSGSSATVSVTPPLATLGKSVSTTGPVSAGATLTYTLSPSSPGPTLFSGVRFFDAPPLNTGTPTSISAGGTFGAYTPRPAADGDDPGDAGPPVIPSTLLHLAAGATPFTYLLGDTATVTMTLTNRDAAFDILNVVPDTPISSDGLSMCGGPVPASQTVPRSNGTATFTFSCTVNSHGEIFWSAGASGTYNGAPYTFVSGDSSTVLGVPTQTGTSVIQWLPTTNSNTQAVPSVSYTANTGPGLFAFNGTGGGGIIWERYDIPNNGWITSPTTLTNNLPSTVADGAALVYDGNGAANGYVYAFAGGGTAFWRYKISDGLTGSWTAVAPAPWTVGAGGALTRLGSYIYGLQGNAQQGFARYDATTNSWTALANVPLAVGAGGALATDGTFIYALRGNNQKNFYRYNVSTNSWSSMANALWAVRWGGSLTSIGTTLYALRGNNSNRFAKYVPNATTGKWTALATTPSNIGTSTNAGAALATDGTKVFALRGTNTTAFWSYDPFTNLWTAKATTLAAITTGGALTYVPPSAAATLTNTLSAPVLVTGSSVTPATVAVTMTLTASAAISGITPTALTVTRSNASTPTCSVSPATPQSVAAGGSLTFTWTCTNVYATGTTAATTLGSMTFSAGATATTPVTTFAAATSNSLLVAPPLTYQTTVNTTPTTFTEVANQALLSDDAAFSGGVLSNAVTTTISRPPNVILSKLVTPAAGSQVVPGDTLTYSIDLINASPGQATNVVVSDVVPANTAYVSCTTTVGTCSAAGSTITYTLGNLPGYATATLTMSVTAATPAAAGTYTLTNQATQTVNGTAGTPSNSVSNTLLAIPLVTIAKSESVTPAPDANGFITPGSTITYTLTVTNPAGAVPATGVVVTDPIPAGTTYVSSGASAGTCTPDVASPATTRITCSVGTIAAAATATITLIVTVNNPAEDGGSISNVASMAVTGLSLPVVSNEVTYPVKAAPILSVTKTSSPTGVVHPGDTITYTLTIKNTGDANTSSAYVHDTIPPNTTYVPNSTFVNGSTTPVPELAGAPLAGSVKVYSPCCVDLDTTQTPPTVDGGTLVSENAAGGTANDSVVTYRVIVGTPLDNATSILNGVTAATATTTPVNASVTLPVYSTPVLTTAKSVSPAGHAIPGQQLTYTITLTNSGNMNAAGVTLTDTLPANTTYVAGSASDGGSLVGGVVTWSGLSIAAGASLTRTFAVTVAATWPAGTAAVTNAAASQYTAYADATLGSATTTTATSATVTTPIDSASLTLSKTASPAVVNAGQQITYTLTYTSSGTVGVSNVVLTDPVPANTTFVSATGGGINSGGTVTWTLGSLSAGASGSVTMTVQTVTPLPNGTTLTNTATIDSTETAPVSASKDTTISSAPVLTLTKSAAGTVNAGGSLVYTLVFANNGNADASGVVLTDTLPANTTFVSASNGGTLSGATVTWTVGALPAGATQTYTLTVNVATPLPNGTTLTNTATIDSTETAPVSASKDTTVTSAPVLSLTKAGAPTTVKAGELITYTLTFANNGNADASGMVLTDAVPANTTFVGASAGGTNAGGTVTWNLGTVGAGSSGSVTMTVQVLASYPTGTITNTGSITGTGLTPVTATTTTAVTADPVLTITKTAGPNPVEAGQEVTWTISFENAGYADATGVVITDPVPTNTTYVGATGGGTLAGGNVVWNLGTVSARSSGAVTMTVKANAGVVHGTVLTNTATIDSNETAPVSGTTTVTVNAAPVLTLTKVASSEPVAAGEQLTYVLSFGNSGNTDATGVVLTDTIPTNTTFLSASGGGSYAAGTVRWNLGTVAMGSSGSVSLTVTVNSPLTDGTKLNNNAAITSVETPAPVTATTTTTVTARPVLTIAKSGTPEPVAAGGQVVYTITFTNSGNANATGVVLTDALPAHTSFAAASAGGTAAGGVVTWNLGTVAAGASGSVTVTANVATPLDNGTGLVNTATITSAQTSPESASASNTVSSAPVLVVEKTAAPDPVEAGGQITWTISYRNEGNANAASAVLLSDVLPAHTTFVSASGGGVYSAVTRAVSWSLGTIAAGTGGSVTLVTSVASPLPNGTTLTNAATISSAQTPPVTATTTDLVSSAPVLAVSKAGVPEPVVAGQTLTYTIEFSNSGNEDATGVVLTDTLPANTSFSSASSGGTLSGNVVSWNLGTVGAGTSGSVTLVVTVASPLANGTTLVNGVTIDSAQTLPQSTTSTNTVSSAPVLTLNKTGTPEPVAAGQSLTYTLTFANSGNADATGVVITDVIPMHTSFMSASSGGTYAAGVVTWNLGTVGAGTSGSVTLTVSVASPLTNGTPLVNAAAIDAVETVPVATDWTSTVSAAPLLSLSKTGTPDPVVAGATLTYTIAFSNSGNADATGVTLSDALPANTTFRSASSGGVLSGTVVSWSLGTVGAGTSGSVTLVVNVASPLTNGTLLVNAVTIDSAETSPLSAEATNLVSSAPVLTLGKTSSPATVAAGGNVVYTISYANGGNANATGVVLSDTLPAHTTFVSASGGGSYAAGVVSWNLGTITAGASGSVTVTVQTATPLPNGTTLTNTTTIDSSETAPVSADVTTTISSAPVLTLTKSAAGTVSAGGSLVYTLLFANQGNEDASGVVLTDTLPANTTFVSASNGGTLSGATVIWNVGALLAGTTRSYTLTVHVATPLPNGTTLTNTATIDSTQTAPLSSTADSTVTSAPVLTVTKSGAPSPVSAGGQITWTINYRNDGNANATGVVLTDALPSHTTFVSATGGGTSSGNTVTWNIGSIAAGTAASVTVTASVASPLAEGTPLINTTALDSNETAPVSDDATVLVTAQPALTIQKSGPLTVLAGGNASYTITIHNAGNANATGVVLTDPLPPHTSFVSASNSGTNASGMVTWNVGSLNAGSSATRTVTVAIDTTVVNGTVITNGATIDCNETPPNSTTTTSTVLSNGTVTGVVFSDSNGSGGRDAGESGIAGVTVQLVALNGNVVATVTTDAAGSYTFNDVPTGSYSIRETDPSGYASTTPNIVSVSVSPTVSTVANFGDQQTGTIGGTVWNDANGTGTREAGEAGIAGVTLTLYGPGGAVIATTTTAANGTYLFTAVATGSYTVGESDPAGYVSTTSNSVPVSIAAGGAGNADFGDQQTSTVSGTVWNDRNGDGLIDGTEGALAGVTVGLYDAGGTVIATTVTNAVGNYTFSGVSAGSYTVRETDPSGYVSTTPNTASVSVAAGGAGTANFGDQQVGTIGGTVFGDLDGNGIQAATEPGLGAVVVTLYDANGIVLAVTITAADGSYQFSGVVGGSYTVRESDPSGYVSSTSNVQPVSVPPGGAANANFGDQQVGSVSGSVWNDVNGDSGHDPSESGIGGVTVSLFDSNGQLVATTTTAGDGSYTFAGVTPGSYTVRETDPTGYFSTTVNAQPVAVASGGAATASFGDQQAGTVGGTVFSDLDGDGIQDAGEPGIGGVTVQLCSATNVCTTNVTAGDGSYHFSGVVSGSYTVKETDPSGYFSTTANTVPIWVAPGGAGSASFGDQQAGTVSGLAFDDLNGNGYQDAGEPGIAGVVVKLCDANGIAIATTTTAGDGTYLFTGVPPGVYTMTETDPAGFVSTTANSVPVSIPPGGGGTANFGDQQVGTISGVVWSDADGDGVNDAAETGLGGVVVTLADASGKTVATTTTAGDGSYLFTGIVAGTYTVRETDPAGFISTTVNTVPVSLAPGGAASASFGDQQVGTVGGSVFNDFNGDGIRQSGEEGIGGVIVQLCNSGLVCTTTTTTGDGSYLFTGVTPGTYNVMETDPAGYFSTTSNAAPISVAPGGAASASFGDQQVGSVGGTVFNDANGNGLQDSAEDGIGGVVVNLYGASGDFVATTTTAADGSYLFAGVIPRSYVVRETDPSAFVSTTANAVPISVAPNGAASANFGDQRVGTIAGTVWNDLNGNGLHEAGESGIGGVMVRLYDTNGNVIATTTTVGDGSYAFTGIVAGAYSVREIDPPSFASTTTNSVPISLPAGGAASADFGDQQIGTIAGKVYNDIDGDHTADLDEHGLGGVTVELLNAAGQVIATTTTSGDGSYLFPAIVAGSYSVRENDPSGFVSTTSNLVPVNLAPGGAASASFGDQQVGTVVGVVFDDLDGDAVQDPGEQGIGGVTVQLCNSAGVCVSGRTAGDGSFIFIGIASGTYTVNETDPAGFVSTSSNRVMVAVPPGGAGAASFGDQQVGTVAGAVYDDLNGNGLRDPGEPGLGGVKVQLCNASSICVDGMTAGDGTYVFTGIVAGTYTVKEPANPAGFTSTTSDSVSVTLPPGGAASASFGDRQLGTISGTIYNDQDHDATRDAGESGIANVVVTLLDSANNVVATTVVLTDGSYLFSGVPAGTYTVRETDPPGTTSTTPNSVSVTLAAGASQIVDFGDLIATAFLTLAKAAVPISGATGQTVTYTITFTNGGTSSATNVVLRDPLPAGTEFVSATSGGTYDTAARVVTWSLGTVSAGGHGSVAVLVRITALGAVTIVNTATITSNETPAVSASVPIQTIETVGVPYLSDLGLLLLLALLAIGGVIVTMRRQ